MQSALARGETVSRGWRLPILYTTIPSLMMWGDTAIILLTSIFIGIWYHLFQFGTRAQGDILEYFGMGAVFAALVVPILKLRGCYRTPDLSNPKRQIANVILTWWGVLLFLAGVAFALKIGDRFSRGTVLSLAVAGGYALILHHLSWRALIKWAVRSGRLQGKRIALIAQSQSELPELASSLRRFGFDVVIANLFPNIQGMERTELRSLLLSTLSFQSDLNIDEVVIAADWRDRETITTLVRELRIVPLPVKFIPDEETVRLLSRPSQTVGDTVAIELQRAPLGGYELFLKRTLDITVASLSLFLLCPLLAFAAIAIKLDTAGPVLFRQTRHGFNGRPFKIFKFRTMSVLEDGAIIRQATESDPRVTGVGYWLRRTSIDELPQLLNILIGDMSIVGPRPHAVAHNTQYDKVIADYALRHHMKPGLSGWAQVNGQRGETPNVESMERRLALDLWYIDNWSVWLDIKIIVYTAIEVLRRRNAY